MTLHGALQENAAAFPGRSWLHCDGASWTYAEGDEIADRIAAGLMRIGVRPGDRVALLLTNCAEIVFCYFACFKIGAVAVPVNTRFQVPELIYAIGHAGARVLIGQPGLCAPLLPRRAEFPHLSRIYVTGAEDALPGTSSFRELSEAPDASIALPPVIFPQIRDDQLAVLLYTSGTTARPKGVMHSHATLRRQSANYIGALGADMYAQTLIFLPLCHIAGFSVFLLPATEAGGSIIVFPRFEADAVLRTMAESRATYSGGLPVHINMLVNCADAGQYDMASLRLFVGGGDCVPLELQNRFQQLFGVDVDELCGMTEVMYAMQPHLLGDRRPGSIGQPFGDVRLRLVDADGEDVVPGTVGEIVVHSGAVTLGYWNDPENTALALQDGGMRTGDLAYCDEDGFYWFAGRSKDVIIRGGSNIAPGEVEDVLYAHPAVYEAGVVGAPCPELGQRVRAYVALRPGAQASEAELTEWAGRNLAAYKVPERIVFVPDLPKGPTGKVLRKALRELASAESGQTN